MQDNTAMPANPTWTILFYHGFSTTYFNRPFQPAYEPLIFLGLSLHLAQQPGLLDHGRHDNPL